MPSPWFTLIAPGSGAALAHAHAQSADTSGHAPVLARIAGRGTLSCEWNRRDVEAGLRPWQRGLLSTLDLPAADFGSAPVSAFGSRVGEAGEYWMQLEPVHFAAGLDRLSFLPLSGAAAVQVAERAVLAPLLAGHLRSCGMELQTLVDGGWAARCERSWQLDTTNPDAASAAELDRVMPKGADAGPLRRLMTELQMVLHDHAVNDARARLGLPAINAVWFWGAARMPQPKSVRALPLAAGDAPYLRGLYDLHNQSVEPGPTTCDALLASTATSERVLAVVPCMDLPTFEQQWIAPLVDALASRRIARLDLILDSWLLQLDRGALRRFWRKPLSPMEWKPVEWKV